MMKDDRTISEKGNKDGKVKNNSDDNVGEIDEEDDIILINKEVGDDNVSNSGINDISIKKQKRDKKEIMMLCKCQLCGEPAQRAVSVKCCSASTSCRSCATIHIERNRTCWKCKSSLAKADLINDYLTRAIVADLKENKLPLKTVLDELKELKYHQELNKNGNVAISCYGTKIQSQDLSSIPEQKIPESDSKEINLQQDIAHKEKENWMENDAECYYCNENGHSLKQCPQKICSNCNEKGHSKISELCPNKPCERCNEVGHKKTFCPNMRCGVCSHIGHIASMCPKIEDNTCQHCGQKGHLESECTVMTCSNGNKIGHFSIQCPNITCLGCNETGHTGKRCPKKRCTNCNEIGHTLKRCPERRCPNCNEIGHLKRDCTNPSRCLNCSEIGHWSFNCPKKRRSRKGRRGRKITTAQVFIGNEEQQPTTSMEHSTDAKFYANNNISNENKNFRKKRTSRRGTGRKSRSRITDTFNKLCSHCTQRGHEINFCPRLNNEMKSDMSPYDYLERMPRRSKLVHDIYSI